MCIAKWNSKDAMNSIEKAECGDAMAQFLMGLQFEEVGLLDKALQWYEKSADRGCLSALVKLAEYYAQVSDNPDSRDLSFKYYWMAADRNDYRAKQVISEEIKCIAKSIARERGVCFMYSHDDKIRYVCQRDARLRILRRAADLCATSAQLKLGRMYENGSDVDVNPQEAFSWYLKAATAGEKRAQDAVGWCYLKGIGVDVDEKVAMMWFRASAKQGHTEALWNLAVCLDNGIGCCVSKEEAFKGSSCIVVGMI